MYYPEGQLEISCSMQVLLQSSRVVLSAPHVLNRVGDAVNRQGLP